MSNPNTRLNARLSIVTLALALVLLAGLGWLVTPSQAKAQVSHAEAHLVMPRLGATYIDCKGAMPQYLYLPNNPTYGGLVFCDPNTTWTLAPTPEQDRHMISLITETSLFVGCRNSSLQFFEEGNGGRLRAHCVTREGDVTVE